MFFFSQDQACECMHALSFWDETAIYRSESHPLMVFDLEQKEQRERREAGTQFEPHGHLSAGGPHACILADNKGWEGGRDLRSGGGDRKTETSVMADWYHTTLKPFSRNWSVSHCNSFTFPLFHSCFSCLTHSQRVSQVQLHSHFSFLQFE